MLVEFVELIRPANLRDQEHAEERRREGLRGWDGRHYQQQSIPARVGCCATGIYSIYMEWSLQGRRKLTGLFCISSWLAPYIPDHADIGSYSQSMQPEATITTTSHNSLSSSNSGWHKRQANMSPNADADALSHTHPPLIRLCQALCRACTRGPRKTCHGSCWSPSLGKRKWHATCSMCAARAPLFSTLMPITAHLARWLASPGACYPSCHCRAPVKGDSHRCCQGALCAW